MSLYQPDRLLQVVGHTPVAEITGERNDRLLSCDTFSTRQDRTPIGNEAYCIIDTQTGTWEAVSPGIIRVARTDIGWRV